MNYLRELGLYQAKVLRTARAIVEADRLIVATSDAAQNHAMKRHVNDLRAMLCVYEEMVSFLNCCIEIDRGRTIRHGNNEKAKHA